MRFSYKAIHAMRALASMKPKPHDDASWYGITVVMPLHHDDEPVARNPRVPMVLNYADGAEEITANVSIHDEIGIWGVGAKDFIADLNLLADMGVGRINLSLHSPGGDYYDGLAIYNALKSHPAQVNVRVLGLAASAASYIAMAGDHIEAHKATEMMIHRAQSCDMGDCLSMRKTADKLEQSDSIIAGIYADRTGTALEDWLGRMTAETFYTAEQALEVGLIDSIVEAAPNDDTDNEESYAEETVSVAAAMDRMGMTAVSNELLSTMAEQLGLHFDPTNKTLTPIAIVDKVDTSKAEEPTDEPTPAKAAANADDTESLRIKAQAYELMYADEK